MSLLVRAVSITVARSFVAAHHRHSRPPVGAMFALGCWRAGQLVGVAMVGRPVARLLQDGASAEVTRCCTDGTRNACSILYGAARKAARRRGLRRLFTYTLQRENGASLRAVGATIDGATRGRKRWHCPSRPRKDAGTWNEPKTRWRLL